MWKEGDGVRTYFFYADEGLVAEYDANGNELRSYGWQPDSTWGTYPLWLKQNGQYYFYQNDHLGTPQKLLDTDGNTVWEARYDAFGKAEILKETVVNNLRFPGQYYDAETGLHYNFHRYDEPLTGRYTQADPIGFDGGDVNLYAYVGNNPLAAIDFYGLSIQILGSAEEKALFVTWLNLIAGTQLTMDTHGNISSDFVSTTDFEEIGEWLRSLIHSQKKVLVQFRTAPGGSFRDVYHCPLFGEPIPQECDDEAKECGLVSIHPVFKNPQQRQYTYYSTPWYKRLFSSSGIEYYRGPDVLAHEFFGHALDWDQGIVTKCKNTMSKSELQEAEARADDRANKIRVLLGWPLFIEGM